LPSLFRLILNKDTAKSGPRNDSYQLLALGMKKNKVKKKVTKQDQKKPEKPALPPTAEEETTENPFDFGGLPNRDLKKNLGCG
jgi:hypothetical protein